MPEDRRAWAQVLGPVFLGVMAFTGVFARGLVNGTYGLLVLWGVFYLITSKKAFWRPTPPLPAKYLWGLGLYLGTVVLTSLTGSEVGRGFAHLGNVIFLLATFALTWLALSQWPPIIKYLVPLYALGLIVAGFMTFKEASFGLACVRAKASLGRIELGAVLSQVTPLLVGAAAVSYKCKEKGRLILLMVALVASLVAHVNSCSRIALLASAVLTVMTLLALRSCFGTRAKIAIASILVIAAVLVLSNDRIVSRFKEMSDERGTNINNDTRFERWKMGKKIFLAHPILGVGPRAIPHSPPVPRPNMPLERDRSKYAHAHQVFLTVLAESGVVGLLGFLALHIAPLILLWPYRKIPDPQKLYWVWGAFAVAGQLFFNGLTDNVFTLKPLMYIYWIVTGTALWLTTNSQDNLSVSKS